MAVPYSQLAALLDNPVFLNRVKIAMNKAAAAVYNEAPAASNHATRASFSTKVMLNQGYDLRTTAASVLASLVGSATFNIAAQPDFGVADSDIDTALSAIWNALAGV